MLTEHHHCHYRPLVDARSLSELNNIILKQILAQFFNYDHVYYKKGTFSVYAKTAQPKMAY